MSALTDSRDTRELLTGAQNIMRQAVVGDGVNLHIGAIAALDADGNAMPAADATGLVVVGICEGTTPAGLAMIRSGVWALDNGADTEALTIADVNRKVYVVDDHTVGKVGGVNHVVAGVLRDVRDDYVAVEIGNQTL